MLDSRISHEFSGISGFDLGGSGLGFEEVLQGLLAFCTAPPLSFFILGS